MSNTPSRKRPAPGLLPLSEQSAPSHDTFAPFSGISDVSQLSDDQFMAWGAGNQVPTYNNASPMFTDEVQATTGDDNSFQTAPSSTTASNQLIRRNQNQQISARNRAYGSTQNSWNEFQIAGEDTHLDGEVGNDHNLEQLAAQAKRDALAKRPPKQIPPFIQKLSRFLDEEQNTDLIRWSDDGNSFFVLDEDEFAKNLIPMLFKHDKYASFVRQLNMYGFHKKVGLSDNSMRASEQKTKTPSEYYHPYFKRARSELLWLIQKPKPDNKKRGKSQQDDQDSADEVKDGLEGEASTSKPQETNSKDDFSSLRREVEALQRSQKQIYNMLSRLRDQNNQYIQQASHLIANHERHESSINAILQFLATFYNKSLEGGMDPAGMFAAAIPGNNRPQGNVVEYEDSPTPQAPQLSRQGPRRPLALLPAPSEDVDARTGSPSVGAPSSNTLRSRPSSTVQGEQTTAIDQQRMLSQNKEYQADTRFKSGPGNLSGSGGDSRSPSIKEDSSTPENISKIPDANTRSIQEGQVGQEDIMSVIHNVNASNAGQGGGRSPQFDFNSALRHYKTAAGGSPLTAEQQNNVLSMLAKSAGDSSGLETKQTDSSNNQVAQAVAPNFYLEHSNQLQANQNQINMLTRLQQQQSAKVQDLADRLQPLSPNGQIPGVSYDFEGNSNDNNSSQIEAQNSDFDFDSLMSSAYFPDFNATGQDDVEEMPFNDLQATDATTFDTDDRGRKDTGLHNEDEDEGSLFGDWSGTGKVVGSVGTTTGGSSPAPADNDELVNNESSRSSQGPRSTKRRRLQG